MSEIISAVIVITVVVAGLGIYTGLSQQRILGDTLSVKETIEQQNNRISEMLEHLDMFVYNIADEEVGIFVHNSGFKNITMSQLIVNGTVAESPSNFYVRDLSGLDIAPDNKTIPVRKTSEIVLDYDGTSITNIANIVIRTESGKIIQITNNTD
ncbi:hypothetical protein [Candidatus Nitrosopumilus sediminis]|uniref:hypothetical protein n=1 Tax=Candidatus Nitrosopumilus sediminis TaxID=1229909 RepID=UPI000B118E33|nr:hypothetical protein [Candidatus Nitrosopumilus sediminis]